MPEDGNVTAPPDVGIPGAGAVSPRGSHLEYIPALDGLRALAVGLVMAYHLDLGIVHGGFLGVDLFFVLSGFLITTLLLREFGRSGRIDLRGFWIRRARRLLPALFLLVAAVAIAAGRASPYEQGELRWDLLSTLGYVANWRFIAGGQSYFQEFAAPSPLRHIWSLAIEEQFYVVWPLLTFAALWLASKAHRAALLVVSVLGLAIAASAVSLALTYNEADPSSAYFATHTRAHELLIGAAGCVLVERSTQVRSVLARFAPMLAYVGLAVMLAFGVLLTDASPVYYFGGSTVFALAALATILGISTRRGANHVAAFMALRPLPAIGAISYGLYLWHWPLFNWLTTESIGLSGPLLAAIRVLATLVVATASFLVVERPIRQGQLGCWRIGPRATAAGAVGAALLLATMTLIETRGALPIPEFVDNNRKVIVVSTPHADGAWAIVGDSTAMALYPGLAVEAGHRSRTLVVAAFPGCPVGQAERVDENGQPFPWGPTCPAAVRNGYRTTVERSNPSLVFWFSSTDAYSIRVGRQTLASDTDAWRQALFVDWTAALDTLTSRGARVVLILPMHFQGADPQEAGGRNPLRETYRQWAAQHEDTVTVLDPDPVVCPDAPCPARIGNVDLYADKVHLTEQASLIVAKELIDLLPEAIKSAW